MEWIGRRIVPAKEARPVTASADAPAMVRPSFHATSREGVRGHDFEKGDVIWLVSMLSGGSVHMAPAKAPPIFRTNMRFYGRMRRGRFLFVRDPIHLRSEHQVSPDSSDPK